MNAEFKLLQDIGLNDRLNVNFSCEYSEDGRILLLSETGIYILTLKCDIENVESRFQFRKDFLRLHQSYDESSNFDVNCFKNENQRFELYEAIMDVEISNHFIHALRVDSKPVLAKWSSRGLVGKTDCLLAVLTNLHLLEIFVKTIDENEIIEFVSIAQIRENTDVLEGETLLNTIQKQNSICAFTWSHVVMKEEKSFCLLFTGHRNGTVKVWGLFERDANDKTTTQLELLNNYKTKLKEISAMHWYLTDTETGGLTIGDTEGNISAILVNNLSAQEIRFTDEILLDTSINFKTDHITVINHDELTFIITVKKYYLTVYYLDITGEISEEIILKFNSNITGLQHLEKNILIALTLNGNMEKLILDNNKRIKREKITIDIDRNKFRFHGLILSKNRSFLGLLGYPCKFKDLTRNRTGLNFLIYQNTNLSLVDYLLKETNQSLRDFWDCFETLRVSSIQEKRFAWEGINSNSNYDSLPLIQLKILRIIAKMSEKNYQNIPYINEYNIKSYNHLNYAVDIKLAVKRMKKLLDLYFNKKLTLFQFRSLDLLNFFLKEIIAEDILLKANLTDVFVDEIFNVMKIANELEYPDMPFCDWCGEKLIGSCCVPFHVDSRCAISMMPIDIIPGFKCSFCRCVVHKEIAKEYFPIFCPYCDIPMEQRYFPDKILDDMESKEKNHEDKIPFDTLFLNCYPDCSQESINFEDIEENTVEYTIFTDDEEGAEETSTNLYTRFRKLLLTNTNTNDELGELKNDDDDKSSDSD